MHGEERTALRLALTQNAGRIAMLMILVGEETRDASRRPKGGDNLDAGSNRVEHARNRGVNLQKRKR